MKVLKDVGILVAVGLNGDAVAVALLEGSEGIGARLRTMDARAAFAPLELPARPGLYWFAGRSAGEPASRKRDHPEHTLVDGEFVPLSGDDGVVRSAAVPAV